MLEAIRAVVVPLVVFSFLNVPTMCISKRGYSFCLPCTVTIAVLCLYASQFVCDTFVVGYCVLLLIAIVGAALLIRNRKSLGLEFVRGALSFLVILVLFSLIDCGRRFWDFDEFWHWGMMVKETLRLDHFYCIVDSHLIIHKDYPPFLALFESLWCNLCGSYNEGNVTTALHVLEITFIASLVDELVSKRVGISHEGQTKNEFIRQLALKMLMYLLISLTIFFVVSLFDNARTINTTLADVPVALFFAYCMLLVVTRTCFKSPFGLFQLVCGEVWLLMTKQVGMAMFGVVVLAFVLFGWPVWRKEGESAYWRGMPSLAAVVAIPLLVYASWSCYVKFHNVADIRSAAGGNGQFDLGKIDFGQYLDALMGNADSPLLNDTFSHFKHALFEDNIVSMQIIHLSYVECTLLVLIGIVVIAICFRESLDVKDGIRLAITLLTGSICFAAMLSILFLFCFTPDEMAELRGYARYVDSYVIGEIVLIVTLAMTFSSQMLETRCGSCAFIVPLTLTLTFAIVLSPANMGIFNPARQTCESAVLAESSAPTIAENAHEGTSVGVLYIADDSTGASWYYQAFLQYYANGQRIGSPLDLSIYVDSPEQAIQSIRDYAARYDNIYIADNVAGVLPTLSSDFDSLQIGEIMKANSLF